VFLIVDHGVEQVIGVDRPVWVPVFTGLSVRQFGKLVGIVRGRGGEQTRLTVAVGKPLPGNRNDCRAVAGDLPGRCRREDGAEPGSPAGITGRRPFRRGDRRVHVEFPCRTRVPATAEVRLLATENDGMVTSAPSAGLGLYRS
jgi:hypothetical protein